MHHQHQNGPISGKDEWNERYGAEGGRRIWSGEPNTPLVAETAGLIPRRAVDLGCGEGADAIWLATNGWDVTGVDISSVALERARDAADDVGVGVEWICADFVDEPPSSSAFDLVTTHYPALLRSNSPAAIEALLTGVAAGGTLLFVAHADIDPEHARSHGFDPDDYIETDDVVANLPDGWTVITHEKRPRPSSRQSEQSPHGSDAVLRVERPK